MASPLPLSATHYKIPNILFLDLHLLFFTDFNVNLISFSRRRQPCKAPDQVAVTRPLMAADINASHAPSDPVEMRRLNFQTPGMMSHPPIPISELSNHIERLKSNDNLKFSQEYEVSKYVVPNLKR